MIYFIGTRYYTWFIRILRDIYFLSFERSKLKGKYSLIVSVYACMHYVWEMVVCYHSGDAGLFIYVACMDSLAQLVDTLSSSRSLSDSIQFAVQSGFLAQTAKTSAPIVEAVSTFSWGNQIATVEDTTAYPLVIQVLAGIRRKLACPMTKKEPIMPEILSMLVSKFGQQDASSDIHTLCAYLLGFVIFLFEEVSTCCIPTSFLSIGMLRS